MACKSDEIKKDRQFRAWLQTLPCCICGHFREYVNGEGVSQAAHVRHKSGIGTKPLFSAVPLCDLHHRLQHQAGHSAIMSMEAWVALADKYLKAWMRRGI